ncbi:dienelactone hydrolase family protein [Nocardioides sp. SOB77]|uniref:Dienelactone hydrolase family protein n=1 Tax=Nocardioides oceani TaxID=3058369 RepID=A0ABT8FHA0_9ACTN|nr:dienelactone hydrolase family protein [Nocardioides oceani]MDN4173777.1 dienelactone hydrolase family protein [Nocardioides oceani]
MRSTARRRATTALSALLPAVLAAGALALGPVAVPAPATAAATGEATVPGPTAYAEDGPYGVGQRTMRLPSGAPVEVWYPTRPADVAGEPAGTYDIVDWLPPVLQGLLPEGASVTHPSGGVRRAPIARRGFPLVVFSHGFAGFRQQSAFLTAAVASWGYVVAAPDHRSRTMTTVLGGEAGTTTDVQDLRDTITLLGTKSRTKKSWLHERVDMTRVGAVGHSAGGRAVENLAVADARVDTWVAMAGAATGALDEGATEVPTQPGLLLVGGADQIVTRERMEAAYVAMSAPKRWVELGGAGHLAFSDLCEVGDGEAGLLSVADLLGFPIPATLVRLASDGCIDPALAAVDAWPAIRHVVVAQLRSVLGPDQAAPALDGLVEAWPGVVTDSRSAS